MDRARAPAAIEFGRFRVLPLRREFFAEDRPMGLGGRAFDVLMALIEASGAVVGKDALMHRVWPDRTVEENNLQAQISALRRVFGADRDLIRTIGASPDAQPVTTAAVPISASAQSPTNLPEPISELIGRDVELDAIPD